MLVTSQKLPPGTIPPPPPPPTIVDSSCPEIETSKVFVIS